MQALILAGGKGSRLLPYTKVIPKPLMPIGEMPILEIILRQLKNSGFDSVILAVNYMSQMFELFFQKSIKCDFFVFVYKVIISWYFIAIYKCCFNFDFSISHLTHDSSFPNKFVKERPVQTVASAGRKQQGRRTVKLTRSQVAIAKSLGVPVEEYAKYVKE